MKKKKSLKFSLFLLQVKGTLSFASHTSKWSINGVLTHKINLDSSIKRKPINKVGQLCYFFLTFGSQDGLNSCFSPGLSFKNLSCVKRGDILSYKLLGKVHRLKPAGSQDGVCATSRREAATPLQWLVFP